MIRLEGFVQHYSWGKIGKDSLVAQLAISNEETLAAATKPYAEVNII